MDHQKADNRPMSPKCTSYSVKLPYVVLYRGQNAYIGGSLLLIYTYIVRARACVCVCGGGGGGAQSV